MNKELIKNRFSKNLKTYHQNAKVQKRMAEKLVRFCRENYYERVLEIGCGTGFLTEYVCQNINFEEYLAIDIVEDCQEFIKKINPKIKFIQADIEEYLNKSTFTYDLIISNATLQWVENFESIIKKLYSKLNQSGELIFTTFGRENFREIYQVLGTTLQYNSKKTLESILKDCNLSSIEEEIHILAFPSPKDVLKHLQLTGVNAIENKFWTKKDLKSFENAYLNLCSNRPTLTYNPQYIHLIKS